MCMIACANWNNTSNAGVWNVNWNNNRTNSNNNIGLQADYGSFLKPQTTRIVEPQGYVIRL